MCGIGGFINFKENFLTKKDYYSNVAKTMATTLKKRGPDNLDYILEENFCLIHSRLSIRDLSDGLQPMISNCKKYIIVFNGEIYNTYELEKDLKSKGHIFNTTCDTEVILNGFIEYGASIAEKLNGIFSFVIFDKNTNQAYLCRDRFGVKPLYYTIINNTLIFASEIKALSKHPLVNLKLNIQSFKEIFGLFPSRTEGNGVFENIFEIKFGANAYYNHNGFKESKYWNLISKENKYCYNETVEITKNLLTDAVNKQIVSDVPISTFLSGGIDSSIITGIVSNTLKERGKQIDTYSFDFEENSLYFSSNTFQVDQDKKWATKMSKAFDTNHKYLECDIISLIDCLYKAVDAKDYTGMTDIDSSLLFFCEKVSKHHKVALTGECADEIFGGYPWFHSNIESNSFPWIRDLSFRESMLNQDFCNSLNLSDYVNEKYENTIKEVPTLLNESKEDSRRREISYLNIKWFMPTLLERMDRMSMYSGLEARVPFADHRLVEFLWNVPWKYKYNGIEKSLLRDAFKDLLPIELINRKKSPYPKTYNPSYERSLGIILKEILKDNNSPIIPLVNKTALINLIDSTKNYGKPWFGQLMASPQLIAYYIQLDYFMRKYNLTI